MNANFIKVESSDVLEELFSKSNEKPIVLFKHSVTCPISFDVYNEVSNVGKDVYLVVVQSARAISNLIAEKTNIRHESPQAIILKNGAPVYHASHYDISSDDIENFAKE